MGVKIETQAEALIHFFKKMDIEMIGDILDNDMTYQDFRKPFFISKLQIAFETFKKNGDTELISKPGRCNNCNLCDSGCSFIGNNTGNFIDLIIQSENGKIVDLFECVEFLNEDETITKKERIHIDKLNFDLLLDS
jgi:hypothetical protein